MHWLLWCPSSSLWTTWQWLCGEVCSLQERVCERLPSEKEGEAPSPLHRSVQLVRQLEVTQVMHGASLCLQVMCVMTQSAKENWKTRSSTLDKTYLKVCIYTSLILSLLTSLFHTKGTLTAAQYALGCTQCVTYVSWREAGNGATFSLIQTQGTDVPFWFHLLQMFWMPAFNMLRRQISVWPWVPVSLSLQLLTFPRFAFFYHCFCFYSS